MGCYSACIIILRNILYLFQQRSSKEISDNDPREAVHQKRMLKEIPTKHHLRSKMKRAKIHSIVESAKSKKNTRDPDK